MAPVEGLHQVYRGGSRLDTTDDLRDVGFWFCGKKSRSFNQLTEP